LLVLIVLICGHSCVSTGILMCACVWLFLPTTVHRTISRALLWPPSQVMTHDLSQHVGDILTSD
jgi:hypothetical protein